MATHGFDGVDIAFEFLDGDVPEDKVGLTTLIEVFLLFYMNEKESYCFFLFI